MLAELLDGEDQERIPLIDRLLECGQLLRGQRRLGRGARWGRERWHGQVQGRADAVVLGDQLRLGAQGLERILYTLSYIRRGADFHQLLELLEGGIEIEGEGLHPRDEV